VSKKERRTLVVLGAGASLDFGAPTTGQLTDKLEELVFADDWMTRVGGDQAWAEIRRILGGYLDGGPAWVNFEQIYHCAHELQYAFEPTQGAVNAFRPLLLPFLSRKLEADEPTLRALCSRITDLIFDEMVRVSVARAGPIAELSAFLAELRETSVTRIYTTNYDDVPLHAAPDLDVGFPPSKGRNAVRFDPHHLLRAWDRDCLHHLHGSVHFGFAHPPAADADIGELCWFDDCQQARKYASYAGSGTNRMDGSQLQRSAVITGLDKLSRLQAQPFASFYAALARDALTADVIYVIGSGLGDLHLNTWMKAARSSGSPPTIILVDRWEGGFMDATAFEVDAKTAAMWHGLKMYLGYQSGNGDADGSGWTVAKDRTCAVWDRGFGAFLASPESRRVIARKLEGRSNLPRPLRKRPVSGEQ